MQLAYNDEGIKATMLDILMEHNKISEEFNEKLANIVDNNELSTNDKVTSINKAILVKETVISMLKSQVEYAFNLGVENPLYKQAVELLDSNKR